jgi:hypothetical protein
MIFLFCCEPFAPNRPDPSYEKEVVACEKLGLPYYLINFEALVDDKNPSAAVSRVPRTDTTELAIYRGWMLKPAIYQQLYIALQSRGLTLINDPAGYKHCHYLPESFASIKQYTAQSVWIEYNSDFNIDKVMTLLQPFGDRPIILKDFVKSLKHSWAKACFIPSASDRAAVEVVINNFIAERGDELNEGLVFREFISFQPLQPHSKSGMPLTKEHRLFFLNGERIISMPYWNEGQYESLLLPDEPYNFIAKNVKSNFFTMDIALGTDNLWYVVELGDGQVAGLPENMDCLLFYQSIKDRLS